MINAVDYDSHYNTDYFKRVFKIPYRIAERSIQLVEEHFLLNGQFFRYYNLKGNIKGTQKQIP